MLTFIIDALVTVVGVTTPILLAATGELVVEKSGVLNLGIEGMMLIGAVTGFAVALTYGDNMGALAPWLGVLCAALAGAASSMLFAVLVLTLGSNQVATGLALTIFGIGLSSLIGAGYVGAVIPPFDSLFPDSLAGDPLWRVVFGYSPLVYFALIMVFAVGWFLNRTRAGLILRAVGENDISAHSIGYPVIAIRYAAIAFGGALAGIGGSYFSMVITPMWAEQMTAGRGWIALALVVFSGWRAGRLLAGRLLLRRPDDARALRQGLRLLVPAVPVLGFDALHHGRRRARFHVGARRHRKRGPGLSRPALPSQHLGARAMSLKEKKMSTITRRNFVKAAAAGLALPALGRSALAAEPLKIGFIYLGPVGDFGWTWAHDKGRKAMLDALNGQVTADYVENVKEDASAIPILKDLAQQGHKLIFATSYGYMDQCVEVAKQFPDVKFEHCTGYKSADNLGTYNSRFHQGRAVEGTIAGMMSKSGVIGYLGSYKVPEVVLGVNSFTLSAQAVNPKITTKLVMIDSWFDPAKEAAAVETLANLGCDVVAQHTDSPAGLQVCEKRKVWCFGQGADMARFAPKTQLTAIEDIWGPYYISRAKAVLDGTWKADDAWWGFKEGTVVMGPYNKTLPADVAAAADKIIAGWKDGSYDVFTGEIKDQTGAVKVPKGEHMTDDKLATIDWYVQGVQS